MKTLKKLFSPKNAITIIYFLGIFDVGKFFLNIFEASENVQTIFSGLLVSLFVVITVKGAYGEK